MVKDKSTLTNEVVKEQYEEMIYRGLPFLQIFPEMIQESNVAETFRTRTNERNKASQVVVTVYDFALDTQPSQSSTESDERP